MRRRFEGSTDSSEVEERRCFRRVGSWESLAIEVGYCQRELGFFFFPLVGKNELPRVGMMFSESLEVRKDREKNEK